MVTMTATINEAAYVILHTFVTKKILILTHWTNDIIHTRLHQNNHYEIINAIFTVPMNLTHFCVRVNYRTYLPAYPLPLACYPWGASLMKELFLFERDRIHEWWRLGSGTEFFPMENLNGKQWEWKKKTNMMITDQNVLDEFQWCDRNSWLLKQHIHRPQTCFTRDHVANYWQITVLLLVKGWHIGRLNTAFHFSSTCPSLLSFPH